MHRSRLYGLFLDTPDADAAGAFWSGVFGTPAAPDPHEPQFRMLAGAFPGLAVGVQQIGPGDEPRYHVDIETDDIDAETARLTALGAVEINRWLDCHILRAPGGHLLCVIPVHSDPALFDAEARTWP
ncbi:VOC family protein [Actinoplanes sp. RD1]|uniref:VOC family protein n=1 Tax=Actinoplanes sp. RD1 TaxID=3064538 RepID=UPI002741BA24|nr:VOC family protein [Actinoplanes sp. RD1]